MYIYNFESGSEIYDRHQVGSTLNKNPQDRPKNSKKHKRKSQSKSRAKRQEQRSENIGIPNRKLKLSFVNMNEINIISIFMILHKYCIRVLQGVT